MYSIMEIFQSSSLSLATALWHTPEGVLHVSNNNKEEGEGEIIRKNCHKK